MERNIMDKICVFCGSSPGVRPAYADMAAEMGRTLAAMEIELVYGGGKVGLMGIIARTVMECGGRVTGVIPVALKEKEVAYDGLDEMHVVGSMHERKALMAELSDGFVAMPGGIGTIEEFVEVLTWLQLGIHNKPCGLLNTEGYYDKLLEFLDHMVAEGFIRQESREMVLVDTDPADLLMKMSLYRAPQLDKAEWALKMSNT